MVFRLNKQSAAIFLSIGCLAFTACSSQNSSRYGGEVIGADCGPVSVPCQPVLPPVQYIRAPQYVVSPQAVTPPAPALLPAPVTATPEPYIEPYVSPYVEPAPIHEPYIEAEPFPEPYVSPYSDLAPVDDDILYTGPYANGCPEGQIPGYAGGECIWLTPARK